MAKIVKEKPKEIQLLAKRIKQLRIDKGYTSQETFAYDNNYTRLSSNINSVIFY